jgi:hypothetical protein
MVSGTRDNIDMEELFIATSAANQQKYLPTQGMSYTALGQNA